MTRHISDSERLTIAALNRKENELSEVKRMNQNYYQQLKAMKVYISELKESNKILAAQVNYLISKRINNED